MYDVVIQSCMKYKKPPLIWDDWNREHIKKHSVTVAEVEEVYAYPLASFGSKEAKNKDFWQK